ncbi:MAG: hypothetical protein CMD88_01185 [Gammaproteobacteria bacterium]|nr:hypothetical protein [Gammaproteobacteria bacterium]|tara:strand:+ start:147676 stop:148137 length:462 start_codon:yes stop_codon:yes gene_type:complete
MDDFEEKLYKTVNDLLKNEKMNILNINIVKNKFRSNIKIIIDSPDGVNIEDCVKVSKITRNAIQLDNVLDGDFDLEVSSPGINRPLFNIKDYNSNKGMTVKMKLKSPQNNRKNLIGKIVEIKNDIITIDSDGKNFLVSIENIQKANLIKDIQI